MESLAFEFLTSLLVGAALGAMLLYSALRLSGPLSQRAKPQSMEFRFSSGELVGACKRAQRSFNSEDLDGTLYDRLLNGLSATFPELRTRIEASSAHWDNFSLATMAESGPIEVDVDLNNTALTLKVTGLASPFSHKHLIDADVAAAETQELTMLRETVDASPFPAWREQADGKVTWANQAYKTLCAASKTANDDEYSRLFHGGQVAPAGQRGKAKRANVSLKDGTLAPFEVLRFGQKDHTLNFAKDATDITKAEESLRQFLQTLSQTFAALPIGLAVFDHARNLVMFNPALSDLTTLDPGWLTARPTLHDVIDELRELRMIPERRDFKNWRSKIAELEKSAVDGTYAETWTLPNGQVYRFTGQPHPEGAVAFLIEDITAEISLTRKFRRELALSQALIDQLPNAVVVFGADGVIAMTNSAYHVLWNTDPEDALDQLTVMDATRLWQTHSTPNPVWGDARDFATHGGERAEWSDNVSLTNGRHLECRFLPLTGGATMVEFQVTNRAGDIAGKQTKLAAVSL